MKTYVVDGSNVFFSYSPNNVPSFSILLELLIQIKQRGDDFFCIFDANIEHKVKQKEPESLPVLLHLLKNYPKYFSKVTGGIRADDFILIYADTQMAVVISNDRFSEYLSKYTWLKNEEKLIKGNVLGNLVSLPHMSLVFPRSVKLLDFLSQQLQDLMMAKVDNTAQKSTENAIELTEPEPSKGAPKSVSSIETTEQLEDINDHDDLIKFDTRQKSSNQGIVDTETTPITLAEPLIAHTAAAPIHTDQLQKVKRTFDSQILVQAKSSLLFEKIPKKPVWIASTVLIIAVSFILFQNRNTDPALNSDQSKTTQSSIWLDPTTDVMWMRCSIGQTWVGTTCTGQATLYTWYDAQAKIAELNASGGHAGYTDWDLPSIEDLMSIVRCDKGFVKKIDIPSKSGELKTIDAECRINSTLPTINRSLFPKNPAAGFWSVTQGMSDQDAWHMAFDDGFLYPNSKQKKYHIRLNRKPPSSTQALKASTMTSSSTANAVSSAQKIAQPLKSEKIWIDPKTGMMWMPCSIGQTLVNQRCQGVKKQYTWRQANDWVRVLNSRGGYAGYTDWTLPHIEDLFSLSLCRSGFTKQWLIPTKAGVEKMVRTTCKVPNPDNQYWSSSLAPDKQGVAWARGVNFGDGTTIVATQNNQFFVWLVRQP